MFLSTLSHVLPHDVLMIVRKHISSISLIKLRSGSFKLLEFITNLGSLQSCYLAPGSPSLALLQTAVFDLIYGSSRRRPGKLLIPFLFWLYYSF